MSRTHGVACPPDGAVVAGDPIGITAHRDLAVIAGMPFEVEESAIGVVVSQCWDSAERDGHARSDDAK